MMESYLKSDLCNRMSIASNRLQGPFNSYLIDEVDEYLVSLFLEHMTEISGGHMSNECSLLQRDGLTLL